MASTINASNSGSGGIVQTADASGVLQLQTAGTTAVTIDTSQNTGFGTTTPTQKVSTTATSSAVGYDIQYGGSYQVASWTVNPPTGEIKFGGTNTTGTYFQTFYTQNTERMRIDSSGNVCINSTSVVGAEKLGVKFDGSTINGIGVQTTASSSGDGFVIFRNSSGTAIGTISRVSTTNAVAYNTTSDERLKSNIADSQSVLDKLMAVKVRQFDWTEGDLHQDYGFIAQELEPTLSGIVSKGKTDEDMWQLDYSRLTPHLVKAIQELKAINDTQAETINAQSAALAALTARVVALEAK